MLPWQIVAVVHPDATFSMFYHGTLVVPCIGHSTHQMESAFVSKNKNKVHYRKMFGFYY